MLMYFYLLLLLHITEVAATRRSTTTPQNHTTSTPVLVDVTTTKPTLVVDDKISPHPETSDGESLPFVPFAAMTVIFLHIIVAVVYYRTRRKGPDRAHYSGTTGDGTVNLQ